MPESCERQIHLIDPLTHVMVLLRSECIMVDSAADESVVAYTCIANLLEGNIFGGERLGGGSENGENLHCGK